MKKVSTRIFAVLRSNEKLTFLVHEYEKLVHRPSTMAKSSSSRFRPGVEVKAKACHVFSLAKCRQRYGQGAKTKILFGTVVGLVQEKNNKNRTVTTVAADFDIGGHDTKRAALSTRRIQPLDPPNAGQGHVPP